MARLPKLYLLLSSVLLLTGCRISKYNHLKCKDSQTPVWPVISSASAVKYKASIDILKNHLTGLLIVKQTDSVTTHIVFVTEIGMKMFDFEAKNNELRANYVFEPLNKPLLVEALLRNFSNMFFLNIRGKTFDECSNKKLAKVIKYTQGKDKWFYSKQHLDDNYSLYPELQETYHGKKRASKIEYMVNSENTAYYSKINCKQYGLVKFYFELNYIPPSND